MGCCKSKSASAAAPEIKAEGTLLDAPASDKPSQEQNMQGTASAASLEAQPADSLKPSLDEAQGVQVLEEKEVGKVAGADMAPDTTPEVQDGTVQDEVTEATFAALEIAEVTEVTEDEVTEDEVAEAFQASAPSVLMHFDSRHTDAHTEKAQEFSKETVQKILQEIIQSQQVMKVYMKDLTKELLKKPMSFEETYTKVREVQPNDPLEKYGLSMTEFDALLDKYQSDPNVRESIAKIMGAPNMTSTTSEKAQAITVKKIIEVHTFMLEELDKLVQYYNSMPKKEDMEMKTVTIAAQAIVGSKMEAKFGITSEDIESAVLMYHTLLATDQEFATINMKIQHTMGKLMGTPFSPQ